MKRLLAFMLGLVALFALAILAVGGPTAVGLSLSKWAISVVALTLFLGVCVVEVEEV
jgi:hypothetical protein